MRNTRWLILAAVAVAVAFLALGCSSAKPRTTKASASPAAKGKELIHWVGSYEQAVAQAKRQKKPVMVDVMASWCGVCKKLDEQLWTRDDIARLSDRFVAAKVDGDKRPDVKSEFKVSGYPTTLFLTPEGKELGRVRGLVAPEDMVEAMQDALNHR
jgi:thiol:disulfide interchange protein